MNYYVTDQTSNPLNYQTPSENCDFDLETKERRCYQGGEMLYKGGEMLYQGGEMIKIYKSL